MAIQLLIFSCSLSRDKAPPPSGAAGPVFVLAGPCSFSRGSRRDPSIAVFAGEATMKQGPGLAPQGVQPFERNSVAVQRKESDPNTRLKALQQIADTWLRDMEFAK